MVKAAMVWALILTGAGCGGLKVPERQAAVELDLPTVVNVGGPVLSAPRLQAIYFSGFPYEREIDEFLGRLPSSAYWTEVGTEYGLGRPTTLPAISSVTELPSNVGFTEAVSLLQGELKGAAPRGDTIYVLLFSQDTTVTLDGAALCQPDAPMGYHAEATIASTRVPVVVVPDCGPSADPPLSGASAVTPVLSHELVEAASDPFPTSAPAYADVDGQHAIWSQALQGGELADLCANEKPNLITPQDIGYPVQRIWSNAAVRAGLGPCVPVPPGEVYFVAIARLPNVATLRRGDTSVEIPALQAPAGSAASVTVDFRSPSTTPAWQATALEWHAGDDSDAPDASEPASGGRGQSRTLVLSASPRRAGIFPLIVVSETAAGARHLWVGAIDRR